MFKRRLTLPEIPPLEQATHEEMRYYIRVALRQMKAEAKHASPDRHTELETVRAYVVSNIHHHPLNDDMRRCIQKIRAVMGWEQDDGTPH